MADYKSRPVIVNASAENVYNKLSNLEGLKNIIANIPEGAVDDEKKEMISQVEVTPDTISFPAGPVGRMTLRLAEKIPFTLIRLEGENTPVAVDFRLEIAPIDDLQCEAAVAIDIALPAMLKPMVGGTLQKMADQFGEVLGNLKF